MHSTDRSHFRSIYAKRGNPTDSRAVFASRWWRKRSNDGYDLPHDFGVYAASKAFRRDELFRIGVQDDRVVLYAATGHHVRSISPHEKIEGLFACRCA